MNHHLRHLLMAAGAVLCTLPYPTRAAAINSETFEKVYQQYTNLFSATGKEEQFYQLSDELKAYYLKTDNIDGYYKIEMNEAMYECDRHGYYQGIRKSLEVLNKMKEENYYGQNLVYLTLGTILESCGNQSVAKHYYQEALDHTNDHDDQLAMDAYSRMASLLKLSHPDEAKEWNEKYRFLSEKFPNYHQVYLYVNTVIAFAKNDRETFQQARKDYLDYHQQHTDLDNYGLAAMAVMEQAMNGHADEALRLLSEKGAELSEVGRYDLRIRICQMYGMEREALAATTERALYVDSLSSLMLQRNINEMAVETALTKARNDAAAFRVSMLTVVLILAAALIVLLAVFNYRRQKTKERLKEKNEQLKRALSMAEESDRMKTEFVRSVSHEIRTPLNAITGFADIITTPGMELGDADRQDLINSIHKNVKAITDIVNDMLQSAERSSTDYAAKTDSVLCNQLLSQLLYSYRDKANAKIELRYTTSVINRFALRTNKQGLEQILSHLIENAIKFTQEGSIELNCSQPDPLTVAISLSDTGCGIAEDQQQKIFEHFYKVDSFQQGMGLGLSVSKMIARKMGGDLTLDTAYSGGARFVLTLPVE